MTQKTRGALLQPPQDVRDTLPSHAMHEDHAMVKAILVVLQTLLFLLLFGVGSFLPVIIPVPTWQVQTGPGRFFVMDGLVLAALVYLVILLAETLRKRLRGGGGLTTLAFFLAVALGLAMRFGFKSA